MWGHRIGKRGTRRVGAAGKKGLRGFPYDPGTGGGGWGRRKKSRMALGSYDKRGIGVTGIWEGGGGVVVYIINHTRNCCIQELL